VLARGQLLFPRLDLLLSRERVSFQHSINDLRQLARALVHIVNAAFVAFDLGCSVVAVSLGLSRNGKLGDLLRRLVALDPFPRALDIQDKRVVGGGYVEEGVVLLASAATVEAVEAYIEPAGVILGQVQHMR
jgi:hypothetical protein